MKLFDAISAGVVVVAGVLAILYRHEIAEFLLPVLRSIRSIF